MKILVLTPQPLAPLHDGLNLRVYHLFRELAQSHEVWILFLMEHGGAPPPNGVDPAPFAGLLGVPLRTEAGTPFRHCDDFSAEARRAIRDFLAGTAIDAVVAESICMVPYARELPRPPILLDLVDDMSLLVWRSFRSEPNWIERTRYLRAWNFWRQYERRNLRAFRNIMVTSPADALRVARYAPQADVRVVPNGVDVEVFHPIAARADAPEIVFTGVMGFRPNEVAAMHFYRRILPRVKAEIPNVRLTVAGRGPTTRMRSLMGADPTVTITGYVEDIRPYIGRATAYVAPMVSGSGIKNKILEAWAMARPVVATPIAVAGLEGAPGETHIVADSPPAFAEAVIRLLKHPDLGEQMGKRARQLVMDRYRWAAQAGRVAALLETMTGERPAAAQELSSPPSQR